MYRLMPALLVSSLMMTGIAIAILLTTRLTGDQIVYPLDDTYIHLAMARTLSESGTWGINPGSFEPASSSPLWTALLGTVFFIFEANLWAPLILNALCVIVLIVMLNRWMADTFTALQTRSGLLFGVMVLAAVPTVAFASLETTLHTSLYLALLLLCCARLAGTGRRPAIWPLVGIGLLCTVTTLARFETLFTAGILVILALWVRQWRLAFVIASGTAVAVGGYAVWSFAHNGMWLPNSILIKGQSIGGTPDEIFDFLLRVPRALMRANHGHITGLLGLGVLVLFLRRRQSMDRDTWVLIIVLLAMLAQLQFARIGWLFRYEMFLLIPLLVSLCTHLAGRSGVFQSHRGLGRWGMGLACAVAMIPLAVRAAVAIDYFPKASRNIYEQQIQMSTFIRQYYSDHVVGANDIGAVAYLGRAGIVDLWGLADTATARARIVGDLSPELLDERMRHRGGSIVMVYERWFTKTGGLPDSWIKAGEWTIQDNVICGDSTVAFYAIDRGGVDKLSQHLREYTAALPPSVQWRVFDSAPTSANTEYP